MLTTDLHARAQAVLAEADPDAKVRLTHALCADWQAGRLRLNESPPPTPIGPPGRPARPQLVAPRELVQRRLSTVEGRAALIHSITHIEFNAINLALDAVYRFRDLPADYYADWLQVAEEEARHFEMLRARLRALGHDYGDFPAHNGLWEMAEDTAHDHLVRMALVPRVLEARGLDVTPAMLERLRAAGDEQTVAILEIILREEIGHVAIGSRWFKYACGQRGLDPEPTFRQLLAQYMRGRLRGPFNVDARLAAGFSAAEIAALEGLE
ncbi:MAG TPA: ferritin-like domain-containing protein [Gammaproteobacteria bacterium]|nr:ferritin-like domain-containing protein [Gammaproteobacteria bacterium]